MGILSEAIIQIPINQPLEASSQLGYVVNNHGDRKSPKDRVIPLPNGLNGL